VGTAVIAAPWLLFIITSSPPTGATPPLQFAAVVHAPPVVGCHVLVNALEISVKVTIKNMTSPILRKNERDGLEARYKDIALIPVFSIVFVSAYSFFYWMRQQRLFHRGGRLLTDNENQKNMLQPYMNRAMTYHRILFESIFFSL
jgi:nitrate reductase NapE component